LRFTLGCKKGELLIVTSLLSISIILLGVMWSLVQIQSPRQENIKKNSKMPQSSCEGFWGILVYFCVWTTAILLQFIILASLFTPHRLIFQLPPIDLPEGYVHKLR